MKVLILLLAVLATGCQEDILLLPDTNAIKFVDSTNDVIASCTEGEKGDTVCDFSPPLAKLTLSHGSDSLDMACKRGDTENHIVCEMPRKGSPVSY